MVRRVMLCFLLSAGTLAGQVYFTVVPNEMQFFGRGENGFGTIMLAGKASPDTVHFLRASLVRAENDSVTSLTSLKLLGGTGTFSMTLPIRAELSEYKLVIEGLSVLGVTVYTKTVSRLVAGDVFMIAGQSNAEAPTDERDLKWHDSIYRHPCNRALGSNFSTAMVNRIPLEEDARTSIASGAFWARGATGFAGTWGVKLQHDISVGTGIPVCIVNEAIGGTFISDHLPSGNPSDPEQIVADTAVNHWRSYDRAFMKLRKAGLDGALRAVYWYQGESNGNANADSALVYGKRFETLRAGWKADYPSLQKIFVVQINTGCAGDHLGMMRQIIRDIADTCDDVEIMSTVGSGPAHRHTDMCHYTTAGYDRIAANLLPVSLHHLYNLKFSEDSIQAPALVRAARNRWTISLEFSNPVIAQTEFADPNANGRVARLADYFFDEKNASIRPDSLWSDGRFVFLRLVPGRHIPRTITYLPDIFTNLPSVYCGPWILNATNPSIGALSFYQIPVNEEAGEENYLYPNPCGDKLNVDRCGENSICRLHDAFGKLIFVSGPLKDAYLTIDMSGYPAGLYLLEVELSGVTRSVRKVLREER
jgi:hypothetical protein